MSKHTLDRRHSVRTDPKDWVEGQYGVLDLDRLCPTGPCAPRPQPGAWLAEVLTELEKERTAA